MYIDSNNDLYNSSSSIDIATAASNGDFDIAYDTTTQKFIINFYYAGTVIKTKPTYITMQFQQCRCNRYNITSYFIWCQWQRKFAWRY